MSYAELTYRSRNPLKRLVQQGRYQAMLDLVAPGPDDKVLDYGCGDGFFLSLLSKEIPHERLIGFEPFQSMAAQCPQGPECPRILSRFDELDRMQGESFSLIFCMEVLEHLVEKDIERLLENLDRLSSRETRIVITVPSERGIAGALKCLFRRRAGTEPVSLATAWAVLIGRRIERTAAETPDGLYIYSHIGFDHRELERRLRRRFRIERSYGIPFRFLPFSLNNEIAFICRKM